nr:ComEC/Rec2 family competence protein [Acanthopleuribacter pedis]
MTYQGRPRVSSGLNPANRELVGLFLRNGAVPIWRERLGWMGLGHLLSISGLHCGLVWLLLKWLLAWVRSPARRTGAACCGMLLFATHMGWQDSVARATLFLLVFQVLWAVGRRRCWLRVWSVLTAVSVLLDPTCLLRQGFWYSYAVSLGLVVGLGPGVVRSPLVHPWSPRLRWLRALAAAQLFALPVGLLFGVRLNWAAFFWNMAGFPLLLGLLGLFVWAMAGLVSPRCAWVVNSLDEHIAGWFQVMRQSEGLLCEVRFPWEPAVVVLALVLLFCALHYGGRERRWVLCLVLVAAGRCHQTPLQGARMVVLDVGQGSCALLVAENGEGWLLDAGGRLPPFITFEQVLRLYGVRRVRGGLVSHFNRDHYAFLETMDPGVPFWVPAAQLPLFVGHPLLGERRWLGVEAGVRETVGAMQVRLLWPQAGRPAVNANEGSLVALVGVPGGIVLVPGDAGVLSESYWDLPPPQAQQRVLVLGHHGSRSATGTPLLRRFQPDLAVVSCGRNNAFGHPHPTVVARLGRFGVKTWVTAERGTVTLWRREEP